MGIVCMYIHSYEGSRLYGFILHCKICLYTRIFRGEFFIFNGTAVPYTFVSVNRRYNKARPYGSALQYRYSVDLRTQETATFR